MTPQERVRNETVIGNTHVAITEIYDEAEFAKECMQNQKPKDMASFGEFVEEVYETINDRLRTLKSVIEYCHEVVDESR